MYVFSKLMRCFVTNESSETEYCSVCCLPVTNLPPITSYFFTELLLVIQSMLLAISNLQSLFQVQFQMSALFLLKQPVYIPLVELNWVCT